MYSNSDCFRLQAGRRDLSLTNVARSSQRIFGRRVRQSSDSILLFLLIDPEIESSSSFGHAKKMSILRLGKSPMFEIGALHREIRKCFKFGIASAIGRNSSVQTVEQSCSNAPYRGHAHSRDIAWSIGGLSGITTRITGRRELTWNSPIACTAAPVHAMVRWQTLR